MTENRNDGNLLKLYQEKIMKSHQVNTFVEDFSHLGPKWVALPRVLRQDHNCNERRNPFSRDKWFLSLFKEVDILFNLEVLVKKKENSFNEHSCACNNAI